MIWVRTACSFLVNPASKVTECIEHHVAVIMVTVTSIASIIKHWIKLSGLGRKASRTFWSDAINGLKYFFKPHYHPNGFYLGEPYPQPTICSLTNGIKYIQLQLKDGDLLLVGGRAHEHWRLHNSHYRVSED